jgi:hypothetical protein
VNTCEHLPAEFEPETHLLCHFSTPVVAFGDLRKATVATLGLNPSKDEFLNGEGKLLKGSLRRLVTLASLKSSKIRVGSPAAVRQIFNGCNKYFHVRPLRRFFGVLESVLNHIGVSYYDGSACHLDLAQWATPLWETLTESQREKTRKCRRPISPQTTRTWTYTSVASEWQDSDGEIQRALPPCPPC